jgi:hypothetical protein
MAEMKEVYVIQPNPNDARKSFWHRCGVAFVNRDGSLNVKLDLFPGVQIQIRDPRSDADERNAA